MRVYEVSWPERKREQRADRLFVTHAHDGNHGYEKRGVGRGRPADPTNLELILAGLYICSVPLRLLSTQQADQDVVSVRYFKDQGPDSLSSTGTINLNCDDFHHLSTAKYV